MRRERERERKRIKNSRPNEVNEWNFEMAVSVLICLQPSGSNNWKNRHKSTKTNRKFTKIVDLFKSKRQSSNSKVRRWLFYYTTRKSNINGYECAQTFRLLMLFSLCLFSSCSPDFFPPLLHLLIRMYLLIWFVFTRLIAFAQQLFR